MRLRASWLLWVFTLLLISANASGNYVIYMAAISSQQVLAHPERIREWLADRQLQQKDIPNPHWQDNGCISCHSEKPDPGKPATGKSTLRSHSETLCTNCHGPLSDHSIIHITDVIADKDMLQRMPASYRQALDNGKLSCTTCHELSAQCLSKRRVEKMINPMFMRGTPFKSRTDQCYFCHDAKSYQRLDPHDQLNKKGQLRVATCQLCHGPKTMQQIKTGKPSRDVDYNIEKDLTKMCTGCHPWRPHPGGNFMFSDKSSNENGPKHLVVPSEAVRTRMQTMAIKNGIELPLDPTNGKIYCGTCHNVHEKGLFKKASATKGADEKYRLRMQKMCRNCHTK